MDCFFVSVSLRNRPELRDKPVAITHASGPNRRHGTISMSEVASCSYAARKAGIRNGMLLGKARQLCPDLVTLPYEFDAYKSVSEVLYRTVAEFTLDIEAVSCDELYADCTDLLRVGEDVIATPTSSSSADDNVSHMTYRFIDPLLFAQHLRNLVTARTGGCTASVGFGSSKLLARLATKRAKPNGQSCLFRTAGCWNIEDVQWYIPSNVDDHSNTTEFVNCELSGQDAEWLGRLPICELPGVGDAMTKRLASAFGVTTCGDLMLQVTRKQLTNLLGGRTGERVYWLCRGRDPNETFQVDRDCKSVSACMNYGIRLQKSEELEELVRSLVQELVSRMANVRLSRAGSQSSQGVRGRNLTVRVFVRAPNAPVESAKYMGHGICTKSSCMICLSEPSADVAVLYRSTLTVLRKLCPDPRELRGLGIQMHQLSPMNPQLGPPITLRSPSPDRRNSSTPIEKSTGTEIASDPTNTSAFERSRNLQSSSNSDSLSCDNQLRPFVRNTHRRSLRLKRRRLSPSQSINTVPEFLCSTRQPDTQDALDVHQSRDHSPVRSQHALIVQTAESRSLPNPVDRPSNNTSVISCEYDQTINRQGLVKSMDRNMAAVDHSCLHQSWQLSTSVNPRTLLHDRSIEELRQIFANWITSEHRPLLEDVCILASYLVSLIPNDAERVRLCLVSLDRLVNQFTATHVYADAWRTAHSRIQATVQHAVRQFYHNTCIKIHVFQK
ncbi:hypothetical protein P879_03557 [Paragonimus westermani]|uniref:DNA repair protein REV1 n=1 Tax=Paragonimus westermani TaxID=34504 RepID=A0A8T0D384_9TREM|nr:hypothetical protein P879_03557 [Paragonimus westermani]